MAATRRMQRILQAHIESGELVDDVEIAGFTPELREPAAYNGLVVFFLRHDVPLLITAVCQREAVIALP